MNETRTEFALRVQLLPQVVDRVLVLSDVAEQRAEGGWFKPNDAALLFDSLHLPPPGNISQSLSVLERRGLARRRREGGWALTPLGRQRSRAVVGEIDFAQLAAAVEHGQGAELGSVRHALIPPEWAPQQWVRPISDLLEAFPFETNVFCMTRFPRDDDDLIVGAIRAVREATRAHGLTLHMANDRKLSDELWPNVVAHMWACKYGIGLFEERIEPLNDNVLIEVGAMLATGRRCALLRDATVKKMPTDFIAHIYDSVDFEDEVELQAVVHRWIASDLRLGRCLTCPIDE